VLIILGAIGVITLGLARFGAVVCQDLKKIVALSTLSQLSFMVVVLAISAPLVRFCHLIRGMRLAGMSMLSKGPI
jgi:NADH:ubiquinone oxidoreductase subunit 5 (subunit L)/multisubunit Na+/H+ antiporter MnhA subunit